VVEQLLVLSRVWFDLLSVESWEKKESRLLTEHKDQMSQLNDQLHERDVEIKQYETDMQVSMSRYFVIINAKFWTLAIASFARREHYHET